MTGAPVPERYRGVWSRTLLQTPAARDDTSFVRWLQTAQWHADLRVPAGAAAVLPAQMQGFCGTTTVETKEGAEVCTWHRRVDVQPPRGTPDAGRIGFDGDDRLVETGLHADYLEVWQRLPGSSGRFVVLEAGAARWLLAGEWLMRVRPRTAAWPAGTAPGDTLADVVQRHPAAAAALLDFEISFGRMTKGRWTIEQSTLPALRGSELACTLHRVADGAALVRGSAGDTACGVVEWDADASDLGA